MAATFRNGARGTTGLARTINSVTGDQLVLSGTLSGVPGDQVELSGTGGAGNDGVYTVTEFVGGSPSATINIRPRPNQTSGGSAQMRTTPNRPNGAPNSASILSITDIGDNRAIIEASGLTLLDQSNQVTANILYRISGGATIQLDTSGGTNPGGGPTFTFATGPNTIQRSAGDWTSDGYQVGDYVLVSGTVSNNGTHGPITGFTTTTTHNDTLQIGSTLAAESSTATITSGIGLTFLDATMVGSPNVQFVAGSPDTITRTGGSGTQDFQAEGFYVGDNITISGSASNDGTEGPLTAVTATVLSMTSGLTNEGPVGSVTITGDTHRIVRSRGSWTDDGFKVHQHAVVTGTSSNNGRHYIAAITTTTNPNDTLEIASGLTAEGPTTAGAATASPGQNGAWYGHMEPLSDTKFIVRPPDGGPGLHTQGASGTVDGRHGIVVLEITDEPEMQLGQMTGDPELTFDATSTPNTITRDAGSWVTDNFVVGQSLVIDNTTSNDGTSVGPITAISGVGNVTLEFAGGTLSADETVSSGAFVESKGISWNWVDDNVVPLSAPNDSFGSGSIRDYVRRMRVGARDLYAVSGITRLYYDWSGLSGNSVWGENNTVCAVNRQGSPGSGGEGPNGNNRIDLTLTTPTGSESFHYRLGFQTKDEFSVKDGAISIGLFGGARIRAYGSWLDWHTAQTVFDEDVTCVGSIMRNNIQLKGSNNLLTANTIYGNNSAGLLILGTTTGNLVHVGNDGSVGAINETVTFERFLFSTGIEGGWQQTGGAGITVLDPIEDTDLTQPGLFTAGTINKRYTFNPRFVRSSSPSTDPVPISGLTVRIWEIVESTGAETLVYTGTTDANGRLESGAGTTLRRQTFVGNVLYSHRAVFEGAGLHITNTRFTMTSRVLGDINVDRLTPVWEEEFDFQ